MGANMEDLKQFINRVQEFSNKNQYNIKNVDIEFEKIKNSKFFTLIQYSLDDIVNNWLEVKTNENHNIQTIRHFVENVEILNEQCLIYDKMGLSDGYHRLISMKIIGIKSFRYNYVDVD